MLLIREIVISHDAVGPVNRRNIALILYRLFNWSSP